jgi:hypothetical protein
VRSVPLVNFFVLKNLFLDSISDYPSLYPVIPGNSSSILPPVPQVLNSEADLQTLLNPASIAPMPSTSSDAEPVRSCAQEVQELVDVCRAFLNQIQRGAAPWVVHRLNRLTQIHGPMPDDPASVSYWMAMVSIPSCRFQCHLYARSLIETTP